MEIKDSVAVITGGGSGIGKATALSLAKAGSKVMVADVNEESLLALVDEIERQGGTSSYCICDVTKEEEVAKLMEETVSQFGKINVVVPSAGIFRDAFMINTDKATGKVKSFMSTEQFESVVNVNLLGSFLTIREAAIRMVDNQWSGVLFTISSINKEGQPGQLNYASTKASVGLWPKILAGEFHLKRIKNIRVVGIAPGYVETPLLTGMKPEALESIVKNVHIGRLIKVDEIVSTIEHVIMNEAMDGTTIEIAGGVMGSGIAK